MRNRVVKEYYNWIFDQICADKYSSEVSYRSLLAHLHAIPFTYTISTDANRAEDGIELRYRWASIQGYDEVPECLDGPCSVLEMILALALRCEETIMYDPDVGDRTRQWFWVMIKNLGLGGMTDDVYDPELVEEIIDRFLNRDYDPDGTGGLFKVKNCKYDLRRVEIWYQLNWYLNTIA